jgi:hypothetical protein
MQKKIGKKIHHHRKPVYRYWYKPEIPKCQLEGISQTETDHQANNKNTRPDNI